MNPSNGLLSPQVVEGVYTSMSIEDGSTLELSEESKESRHESGHMIASKEDEEGMKSPHFTGNEGKFGHVGVESEEKDSSSSSSSDATSDLALSRSPSPELSTGEESMSPSPTLSASLPPSIVPAYSEVREASEVGAVQENTKIASSDIGDVGDVSLITHIASSTPIDSTASTVPSSSTTSTTFITPNASSTPIDNTASTVPSSSTTSSTTPTTRKRRKSSSVKSTTSKSSHSRASSTTSPEPISPSSPTQIYRNLLIMEESFRQQYIVLRKSGRRNTIFFSFLMTAAVYFIYSVFVQPSIYRAINFFDKLMFLASVISVGLFYLTGLYTQAFVYTPKFIHNANKGIRSFNIKIVKVTPTWKESIIQLLWDPVYSATKGRLIKVILSSRVFTTDTIEAWELYREEYWAKENERSRKKNQQSYNINPQPSQQTPRKKKLIPSEDQPTRRTRLRNTAKTAQPPSSLTPSLPPS